MMDLFFFFFFKSFLNFLTLLLVRALITVLLQCADGVASLCELVALVEQVAQWNKAANSEIRPNNSLVQRPNLFCSVFRPQKKMAKVLTAFVFVSQRKLSDLKNSSQPKIITIVRYTFSENIVETVSVKSLLESVLDKAADLTIFCKYNYI